MKLGFKKPLGNETLCEGENSLRVGLYVLFGCEYKDKSQKTCWIVVKTMNFFTYVFSLTF
jgi:hypothetical protein